MVSNTVFVITLVLSIFLIDRSESYTTFHDAVTGTVIKYPHNWLKNPRGLGITPGSNIVVFDSPNIDSHNDYVSEFSIGIENAPPGFTLDGYLKEFITLLHPPFLDCSFDPGFHIQTQLGHSLLTLSLFSAVILGLVMINIH